MKVALVFDWLDDKGGMERVNLALTEAFPDAPIYTSVFDEQKFPELIGRVKTSFLQLLPKFLRPKHQILALFMPIAFQSFNMSKFDVIISSASSGFAKCVKKKPSAKHICYCHTPIRYLYNARNEYLHEYPLPKWMRPFKFLMPKVLDLLTKIDQAAAKDVDFFISNSNFVGARIKKYYRKNSITIYPGINLAQFGQKICIKKDYFLAIGRFIPYKKFELLVQTFVKNKLPLKLAGTGPELEKCVQIVEKNKAKNIEFLGFIKDENLPKLYAEAKAFLFPAEEDFGLTPIEAMASGTPVIFLNSGGGTETAGSVGIPFKSQKVAELQKSIDYFQDNIADFSVEKMKTQAKNFSEERFKKEILAFVDKIKK